MIKNNKWTGTVKENGFKIKPKTKATDLPESFVAGQGIIVQVIQDKIPCIFSSFVGSQDNIETNLSLKFERNKLVSAYIYLTDLTNSYNEETDFYLSTPEHQQIHLNLLQLKLGKGQESYTGYKWGKVGVAQEKVIMSIYLNTIKIIAGRKMRLTSKGSIAPCGRWTSNPLRSFLAAVGNFLRKTR